ncbi:MAG: DUF697 domain-containing protein [Dissulfurispiraceae bacterium]
METVEVEAKGEKKSVLETMNLEERVAATDKMIKNYAMGAMGVGLMPLPAVDLVALSALQLKLLYDLSKFFNVEFSKEKGKNLIGALLGSCIPVAVAGPLASLMKVIPIIGVTTGALTGVAVFGASTYALGKVFVQHFESGGTFLDFDPAKVKDFFAEQYKEGRKVAADLKKAAPQKSS